MSKKAIDERVPIVADSLIQHRHEQARQPYGKKSTRNMMEQMQQNIAFKQMRINGSGPVSEEEERQTSRS